MNYSILRSFGKKFDSYIKEDQEKITKTLEDILTYLEINKAPHGLRIKKLSSKIYEARIDIHLRIAYFREKDIVKFFCLGNHDDIKFCLKILKKRLK